MTFGTTDVNAGPVSFAQFSESAPGGNLFSYKDNGTSANFSATSVPVNFTYLLPGMPAGLTGPLAAHLTMVSSTADSVTTQSFGPLTIGGQNFVTPGPTVTNTITITLDTPVGGKSDLLTVNYTAFLSGLIGGRTPQLSANTSLGFAVNYTSDFLTFSNLDERDLSLTFSSWTGPDSQGLEQALQNFVSAAAAGAGTFSGTAAVIPEPTSIAIVVSGLLPVAFGVVRRRRAAH